MHHDERPAVLPSAIPAARSPEISALLRDLGALRLSLSADLSLAAAALDEGCPEISQAVLDSERTALRAFEQRALEHLGAASAAEAPAPEQDGLPAVDPAPAPRRARRALLTAATPLVATAAALIGLLAGFVPTGDAPTGARPGEQTAMASYQELTELTLRGAEPAEVARAAERLHDELAGIVALAVSDPAAAQAALSLLESEARVLDSSADREQLSDVIAEARTMVARLRAALPTPVPVRTPRVPVPPPDAEDAEAPVQAPAPPLLLLPVTPSPEPSPTSSSGQSASPAPSPSASPTSSPTSVPEQSPGPRDPDDGAVPLPPS